MTPFLSRFGFFAPFGGKLRAQLILFAVRILSCCAYGTLSSVSQGSLTPFGGKLRAQLILFPMRILSCCAYCTIIRLLKKGPLYTKPVHFSTFLNELLWNLNLSCIDGPLKVLYNKYIIKK